MEIDTMRENHSLLLLAVALAAPAFALAQAPAGAPAAAPAAKVSTEDTIKALRGDLQAARADILAKVLTLKADQAAKFWPMYEKFQAEQNVLIDSQLKGIQKYAASFRTLTDADALALMNAQLTNDEKMSTLRRKWLAEFQKILPAKDAVRVMQVDRRLSNATQAQLSIEIPLVP
jgi:hypothetical protein